MTGDLVARLDRRGALARVAGFFAAATAAQSARAQTLISETGSVGNGHARGDYPSPYSHGGRAEQPVTQAEVPRVVTLNPNINWRSRLLQGERVLTLRRDGGASQRVRYMTADGQLDREGYARVCYLLRDVRANKLFPMDPQLLDVLCGVQRWGEYHGRDSVFNASSGFRTAGTNGSTEGAAKNSLHMLGKATDGTFEGFGTRLTGAMVLEFNDDGGTGIYLDRRFVHIDTGRPRKWLVG